MRKRKKPPSLDSLQAESFYIVKIDAPLRVEVPGGLYVTVQSGPHIGVKAAFERLRDPKPRAHTLPDIVFLPLHSSVFVLDEEVPLHPYMLVKRDDLDRARLRQNPDSVMPRPRQIRTEVPDNLVTPPDKLHRQARLAFTDEKERDSEVAEKRQKVGKLSPKVLHFDDQVKKPEEENTDKLSALKAACTAKLMWMISNPQQALAMDNQPLMNSLISLQPSSTPGNPPNIIHKQQKEQQREEEGKTTQQEQEDKKEQEQQQEQEKIEKLEQENTNVAGIPIKEDQEEGEKPQEHHQVAEEEDPNEILEITAQE